MYAVRPGFTAALIPPDNSASGVRLRISGGSARERIISTGNVTSTQITDLQPANTYKIQIRSFDAAGNRSAWSSEIQMVTLFGPPIATVAATAGIAAVTVVAGSSNISATTVAATASVPAFTMGRIPVATVAAVATVPSVSRVYAVTASGLTAQVTGLTPSSSYTAQVRARDAAGNWSAYSSPISFSTVSAGSVSATTVAATASVPAFAVGGTPPTVTAGRARPVVNGQGVLLDVVATPPGADTIAGYSWAIISGAGSLTNATTATPTYTAPGSGSGLVTIRASVSTNNAGLASADVTVSYHKTVIAAENALTGTARATWDLASPNLGGVDTLQGFCDGFTIDKTGTANFKIAQSDTAGWTAEVYRLGYYGGNGARSYGTLTPSGGQLTSSQAQPSPADADAGTTLISADCAGWSTTLTWTPPTWAPSGIYVLRLNRTGGGASHVQFIVRDDARQADLMFMPADSTWNAYNAWGGMGSGQYAGNSLYYGTSVDQYNSDCARFVSYNRPVVNRGAADSGRGYGAVEWSNFFTAEYPMLRFLERNGLDVKYYGCIDSGGDAAGTHLIGNGSTRGGANAGIFVGHNEYWSNSMRAGWEAARNAGVSVFSCAGNEVFWRTVGTDADSDGRPRTIECQKSTIGGRGNTRPEWTGTWRDPDGAGKGGDSPENSLTGTIFVVNGPDLRSFVVPFNGGYSAQPIWRHTSVAGLTTGQSFSSPSEILGFEWDTYGPAGTNGAGATFMAAPHSRAVYCSDVTYSISSILLVDAGDVYGSGDATHRLVVYPGTNGSMVFGTGTVNWAFGVDDANAYQIGSNNVSLVLQQATINMLTDMGAAPATLMAGLTEPTPVDWFGPTPLTVSGAASVPAVTVTTGSRALPATVAGISSVPAAVARAGSTFTLATVSAFAAVPAGTTSAASSATVSAVTVAATGSIPAVVAADGSRVQLAVVSTAASVAAPVVAGGAIALPATVPAAAGVAQVAVSAQSGSIVTPTVVVAVGSVAQPSIATGSGVDLTTASAASAVAAPSVTTGSQVDLSVVAAASQIGVAQVSAGGGTTVAAGTVAAVAAVGAVAVSTPASATVAAVVAAAVSAVPQPTVAASARPTPATVGSVAAVPSPSMSTGSTVAVSTVPAVSSALGVVVRSGETVGLATVSAVASVPNVVVVAQAGSGIALAPVAATSAVPTPAVTAGSSVGLQTAQATASVPSLTITIRAAVQPATVAAVAFVWPTGINAEALITIGTVAARASIGSVIPVMLPVFHAYPHGIAVRRPLQSITATRSLTGIT